MPINIFRNQLIIQCLQVGSIIITAALIGGCATRGDVDQIITDLDTLKKGYVELYERHAAQDSLSQIQSKASRTNYAEISYRLDQLTEHLILIENKLDDLQSSRVGQSYPENTPPIPEAHSQQPDSLKRDVEISSKRIYDTAYMDFIKGDYKIAIAGFKEYLKQNPKTSLSDNADFLIGECYFNLNEYDDAAEAYTSLLKNKPKSEKAPDALLRMVEITLKKKDSRSANRYYDELMGSFPDSPQAERAKELLKKSKKRN